MSKQHDRITKKLGQMGMAWAASIDKYCDPNDPFEDQISGNKTYHIHPDVSYPHTKHAKRFHSLQEIEEYLAAVEKAQRLEAEGRESEAYELMSEW